MGDAARRRFDVLVVWRFDRLARSVSHLLRALEQFQAMGIDFVSLSENVDTSTPTGKMVFTVLGAVADLERSLIVERVKAGIRNAPAQGKKLGRPGADVRESQIEGLRASGLPGGRSPKRWGLGSERSTESASGVPKTPARPFLKESLEVLCVIANCQPNRYPLPRGSFPSCALCWPRRQHSALQVHTISEGFLPTS
jgi:DNA invertase Pin-like site-specific DNA recombinase